MLPMHQVCDLPDLPMLGMMRTSFPRIMLYYNHYTGDIERSAVHTIQK